MEIKKYKLKYNLNSKDINYLLNLNLEYEDIQAIKKFKILLTEIFELQEEIKKNLLGEEYEFDI